MKHLPFVAASSLVTLLAIGCSDTPTPEASPSESSTTTLSDVKSEMSEAADAAKEFAGDQKEDAIARLQQALNAADEKIQQLGVKIGELQGDAKQSAIEAREDLESKRAKLQEGIENFKNSTGDAWAEVSKGLSASMAELEQSLDSALNAYQASDSSEQ